MAPSLVRVPEALMRTTPPPAPPTPPFPPLPPEEPYKVGAVDEPYVALPEVKFWPEVPAPPYPAPEPPPPLPTEPPPNPAVDCTQMFEPFGPYPSPVVIGEQPLPFALTEAVEPTVRLVRLGHCTFAFTAVVPA